MEAAQDGCGRFADVHEAAQIRFLQEGREPLRNPAHDVE
jgi:hypothetical protein